jgi:hypothetical protein
MSCPNVNSNDRPIGVSYDSKNRAVGFLELSSIQVESISATDVSAASFTPAQFPFIFNGTISATAYLGAGTGDNFLDLGDVTASTIQPNQLVFGSIEYPGTLELSSASSVILYNGFILASQVSANYATTATTNQLQADIQALEDELEAMSFIIPNVINDLSDVQTSANAQGNLLIWSSSLNKWVNTPSSIFSIGGGVSSLSSLNDVIVDIPELNIGNILIWDGNYWVNSPSSIFSSSSIGSGVSSLSALSDVIVDIPELSIGNILSWDGNYWVNSPSSIFVTTPITYFSSLLDTPANYTGASSNFVIVNSSGTGLAFSAANFASSTHTHSYSLESLTNVLISDIEVGDLFHFDGIQFSNITSSIFLPADTNLGASSFLGLSDTPSNYTGASSNFVIVNSAGNALQFSSASFASSNHNHALSSLTDTVIAGISLGNVLTWDGSNWVNTPSSVLSSSGGGSGISEEFATLNYLNASGDSASASFYLQDLSSTTLSSTDISAVNIFADNLVINTLDLSATNLSATNLFADNFILSTLELSANSISATNYQNITLNETLEDVNVEFLAFDDILTWNGSIWINSSLSSKIPPLSLDFIGLDDTPEEYTGASSNFVIVNPSGTGLLFSSINFASSVHSHTFESLSDTLISDISNGDIPVWNGDYWVNTPSSTLASSGEGVSFLSSLNDVTLDVPELNIGNILSWDGAYWVNIPSSLISSSGGGEGISEAFATDNYLNASGDSASASFYLQTLSSTTLSSTDISAVNIFADNLVINTLDLSATNLSATNLYADNFILSTLELSANSISATNYQNITLNETLEDVFIDETEFEVGTLLMWDGSQWINIKCDVGSNKVLGWDTVSEKWKGRTISYGTSAPSGGEDGDIYLQYE